jgi:hypothetical protein
VWYGGDTDAMVLDTEDPLAVAAVEVIHNGDMAALQRLLVEHPELATDRLGDYDGPGGVGMSLTFLHVVTDWPGTTHGAATVAEVVAADADVTAQFTGPHTETPLHWGGQQRRRRGVGCAVGRGRGHRRRSAVTGGGTRWLTPERSRSGSRAPPRRTRRRSA